MCTGLNLKEIGVKLEVRMMQKLDVGCELKEKEMSTAHLCAIWSYFKSCFMSASEKFNANFIFRVIYILYFSRQCKESSHANYANPPFQIIELSWRKLLLG